MKPIEIEAAGKEQWDVWRARYADNDERAAEIGVLVDAAYDDIHEIFETSNRTQRRNQFESYLMSIVDRVAGRGDPAPTEVTERENGVTSRVKLLADIYGDDTAEISKMSAYLDSVRGASA